MSDTGEERRRSRRAKKNVNYSKEQDFSDEDIFEDPQIEDATPKRAKARSSRKSTGSRRKSGAPDHDDELIAEDDFRSNKLIYMEKGYDSTLPPIRERFPFVPEVELDGSPKIDLIVGRRRVDEKGEETHGSDDESGDNNEEDESSGSGDESEAGRRSRRRGGAAKKKEKESPMKEKGGVVEYEYLIKYKNRSYLHLEWKSGADLESMNKSAKTIYRRYLKKIAQGLDDEIENPEFDPSYIVPQKIVAEKEQEMTLELTDKELLKWEKEREKELAEESDDDEDKAGDSPTTKDTERKEADDKASSEQGSGDSKEKKGS